MAISLRQLRYFVRTVDAGNITRAAEQLFVAQPALGLQIRQLEETLGVSLLSRHSRGVSPTRAGTLLYERACEILRMVDDTQQVVAAAGRQDVESVVLGLTYGVMGMLGRDIVISARDELPGIQLTLIEEMSVVLMDALEREELDIAIAYDVHQRPGLLRVPMIEEELVFVTAPSVDPDDKPIPYREMIARPLVLQGPRDVVRQQLDDGATAGADDQRRSRRHCDLGGEEPGRARRRRNGDAIRSGRGGRQLGSSQSAADRRSAAEAHALLCAVVATRAIQARARARRFPRPDDGRVRRANGLACDEASNAGRLSVGSGRRRRGRPAGRIRLELAANYLTMISPQLLSALIRFESARGCSSPA